MAQFMPPLYLAFLYALSRFVAMRGNFNHALVLDALALNWLCCTVADLAIGYQNNVAAYICVDIASGLWLSLKVRGKCSGVAEIFYIALIIFNAAFFFRKAFSPWTHWVGLSMLSWGQLLAVTGGIFRHDLAQAAGHIPTLDVLRRHLGFRKKEASR